MGHLGPIRRSQHLRQLILGLVAAALLVVGPAPTATAESGSKSDPAHDAPARIDITEFTVKNRDKRVEFRVKVRNLRNKGEFEFYYWGGKVATPPARSAIISVRRKGGKPKATFFVCNTQDCAKKPCQKMRARWNKKDDLVRVSVRQRCYPRPPGSPDAAPPKVGRFFVTGRIGSTVDEDDGKLLQLERG